MKAKAFSVLSPVLINLIEKIKSEIKSIPLWQIFVKYLMYEHLRQDHIIIIIINICRMTNSLHISMLNAGKVFIHA